jgi:glycosyltransferase involved in cell wall biosynthesis
VRPFLDAAEVFVAPLRIARGLQNKVLEAMAMGVPVVATGQVWRGTALPEGAGIVPAASAEDFAAAVVTLLTDAPHRAAMGRRARAEVEQAYTWDAQLAVLDRIVAAAVASAPNESDPG